VDAPLQLNMSAFPQTSDSEPRRDALWARSGRLCCELCYTGVVASSTSSFRLPNELKEQLETTAQRMNKGKNWVINQALKEYLSRHDREWLRAEARRQSLLASKKRWQDQGLWERALAEVWNDE
jgi:predicted DNA-binding protein